MARVRNESALGTVTQAVSACALRSLSSPAAAGYGSVAAAGLIRRVTFGIDESTSILWNRDRAARSITSSVVSSDWSPYV